MNKFTKKILFQALDRSPTPTVIVAAREPGLPIAYVNTAVEILTGSDAGKLVGTHFTDMLASGNLPGANDSQPAGKVACAGTAIRQQWHTQDGRSVPLDVRVSPLQDRPGQPGFWMLSVVGDAAPEGDGQIHDTGVLRRELSDARREIKSLQRTDPVTGLGNRNALDEVLERDWAVARRDQRRIGVIVFSIDCLVEYREIFGRHTTDSLLQKVGHAIGGTLRRAGDFGARIANDQFAVIIGDPIEGQTETCAKRIAAKVRNLAIHHPRSAVARIATVSYGVVSEVPAWTKKSSTLFDEAQRQLEAGQDAADDAVEVVASGDVEVTT